MFSREAISGVSSENKTQFCDFNLIKTKPGKATKIAQMLGEKCFEARCEKFNTMKQETSLAKIKKKITMSTLYKPLIKLHRILLSRFAPGNSKEILALTKKYVF